jgi:hypothetical protein
VGHGLPASVVKVVAVAVVALLAAGCRAGPSVDAFVAPDLGARRVVDVAVGEPARLGDAPPPMTPFRQGLREALYQGLLDRRYSPLDPDYVDSVLAGSPGEMAAATWLESEITELRRSSDGSVSISGWVELRTPPTAGEETLYRLDAARFAVPLVTTGTEEPDDGDRAAGRRFGEVLLSQLPPR